MLVLKRMVQMGAGGKSAKAAAAASNLTMVKRRGYGEKATAKRLRRATCTPSPKGTVLGDKIV